MLKAEYWLFKSNVTPFLHAGVSFQRFSISMATRGRACDVSGVPDEAQAQCRFSSEWIQSAIDVRCLTDFSFFLVVVLFVCGWRDEAVE